MEIKAQCVPCMLKRTLVFLEREDERKKKQVISEFLPILAKGYKKGASTMQLANKRDKIISKHLKYDPMERQKKESTRLAKKLEPFLKKRLEKKTKDQRLATAIKIATIGNSIEFGGLEYSATTHDLEKQIKSFLKQKPKIDDTKKIVEKTKKACNILYVCDNAAELVFDKILIQELKKHAKVTLVVLEQPIQDDASQKDIEKLKIDKLCETVYKGKHIGFWIPTLPKKTLKKYREADLVFLKGMGCYESLAWFPKERGKHVVLLKAKCSPVAQKLGVPRKSFVIKKL